VKRLAQSAFDYKQLNNVTEKIAYPTPIINEILNNLANAIYYTVIDLRSAYYQVKFDPQCHHYTAFISSRGLFELTVLQQRITNATETFQRCVNSICADLLHIIVEVYLNDIIVFSNNLKGNIKHVTKVVDRLIQHSFKVRLDKCKIAKTSITYLSHIIKHS
jgi:hypothetical protein